MYIISKEAQAFLNATVLAPKNKIETVALVGPAGCGKTSLVFEVAQQLNTKPSHVVTLMCSKDVTVHDISTSKTVEDGNVKEIVSPVLENMCRDNSVTYLDEFMSLPADVAVHLNSMLDHRKEVTLPNGKTYKRGKQAIVFLSSNPIGYAGVKRQHGGFMDRFPTLKMGYIDGEDKLLQSAFPNVPKPDTMRLAQFAKLIRTSQRTKESRTECSTRSLLMMCNMIENGCDMSTALHACLNVPQDEFAAVAEMAKLAMGAEVFKDDKGDETIDLFAEKDKKNKTLETELKTANETIAGLNDKIAQLKGLIS